MRNDTIDSFLAAPADRVPAPGGGASTGLHAAQAAALLAMVARYSDGKRFAVRAELCAAVNEVDRLVQRAERVTAAVRVERGSITGRDVDQRLAGSVAAAVLAVQRGAQLLRVHDVAATRDALAVLAALEDRREEST
jgi:hypothetical protein